MIYTINNINFIYNTEEEVVGQRMINLYKKYLKPIIIGYNKNK